MKNYLPAACPRGLLKARTGDAEASGRATSPNKLVLPSPMRVRKGTQPGSHCFPCALLRKIDLLGSPAVSAVSNPGHFCKACPLLTLRNQSEGPEDGRSQADGRESGCRSNRAAGTPAGFYSPGSRPTLRTASVIYPVPEALRTFHQPPAHSGVVL